MDVYGCLYACHKGRHNKYYFIVDNADGTCDCYYGRIETLARGDFSHQYRYPVGAVVKEHEKSRKWEKKGDGYELIFREEGSFDYLKDRAVHWANTGHELAAYLKSSYDEEEPVAATASEGWFNNGK